MRCLAAPIACALALLLFAAAAPPTSAAETETNDISAAADRFGGQRGKNDATSLTATRLTEEPVGFGAGRGFNPFGTVAVALQQADCGNYWECNPDRVDDDGGGEEPAPATPTPLPTPTPDPRVYEAIAYGRAHADAVDWVNDQTPSFNTAPPPRAQVVNLRSFFWIHDSWETKQSESSERGVSVTITATPVRSVWRLEEQLTGRTYQFTCDGPGHEYAGNPNEVSTCGHEFDHASSVIGDVALTVGVIYEFTVSSSLADSQSNYSDGQLVGPSAGSTIDFGDDGDAVTNGLEFPLLVNEILTRGINDNFEFAPPDAPDTGPIEPEGGRGCSLGEKIVYYGSVGIPLRLLGIDCGEAFEVLDLLKAGVVACAGGIARSIGDVVSLLKGIVTDPVQTAKDGIAGLQALIELARENPTEFVATVGMGLLGIDKAEWDAAEGDPVKRAELAIAGLCSVAFEIIAGSASRKILDLIPGRRPNRPNDPVDPDRPNDPVDPDRPIGCRIATGSSFPTGTHVRTAAGDLVPIEEIQPGNTVLAADPVTGTWSNQLVLEQWSYLDTDQMTTATLADGTTITATDHHRFWVASTQEWTELELVRHGDLLLTPNGTIAVRDVTTHPQAETLVWELDTAGPDTFTVHTGSVDLLVHNADCSPETAKRLLDEYGIDVSLIDGDLSRLDELVRRLDDPNLEQGARAELDTIKRALDEGRTVEMMPDSGVSGNRNPDFRIDGKLVDVKSTTDTKTGIKDAITDVNHQVKNSDFPGEVGEAIVQLAKKTADFGDLDRQVRRSFNDNRGRSLDSVSVYDAGGNLVGRWVRNADGSVSQVVG